MGRQTGTNRQLMRKTSDQNRASPLGERTAPRFADRSVRLLSPDVAWIDTREIRFGRLILKPTFPVLQANGCEPGIVARGGPDIFSLSREWRPQGDSNPRYRRERAMS